MQLSIPGASLVPPQVTAAISELASNGSQEERGAVFTSAPVVDMILNLVGYTVDQPLADMRLLEPSAGTGDFLIPAIRRLITSWNKSKRQVNDPVECLAGAIRAVELHTVTAKRLASRVGSTLVELGFAQEVADNLSSLWIRQGDFLLLNLEGDFDIVLGNPPYVRQERVPEVLLKEYRRRFSTLYDRADLYVPFFEKSLDLLSPKGRLGFICANRWLKNKYGGPLRAKVSAGFSLDVYIDMDGMKAFEQVVDAYPAITVISRKPGGSTRVVSKESIAGRSLGEISRLLVSGEPETTNQFTILSDVTSGRDPWLLDSPDILPTLRRLERDFPTIEADGCRVRIGVATGCDKVFIGPYQTLPVEASRKLKLVKAPDIRSGKIVWGNKGVVNPFEASGQLADLEQYPLFGDYIRSNEEALKGRHVARKAPKSWYRTIDRISPDLTTTEKLLIPDIKGDSTVVYDKGEFYPHHNLYVVTSDIWDLRVLQAVLRSSVSLMFVAAYCVRMGGGFLRFQAQYIRRIRLPSWSDIQKDFRKELIAAATSDDLDFLDDLVFSLYGLSLSERRAISRFAANNRAQGKK